MKGWPLRCSWSIACLRCSKYIFILGWTPGFNGLGKGNCKARRETLKFGDLVYLMFEVWRYLVASSYCSPVLTRDFPIIRNGVPSRYSLSPKIFDARDTTGFHGIHLPLVVDSTLKSSDRIFFSDNKQQGSLLLNENSYTRIEIRVWISNYVYLKWRNLISHPSLNWCYYLSIP